MQDDLIALPKSAPLSRNTTRLVVLTALLAFLAGAGLVAWLAWSGKLGFATERPVPARSAAQSGIATSGPASSAAPAGGPASEIDARLALIESRLARIDLQAAAASGNATRAEGLLIAFAARRLIDRGVPLGYVADQLRLRFGDSKPNAVQTVIDASAQPVTLDQLAGQLAALGPAIAGAGRDEGTWAKLRREIGGLFVIHSDNPSISVPGSRIDRARLMLVAGRLDNAIAEVESLPGTAETAAWIAAARRYQKVQQALDVIETAAMLDPRDMHDVQGRRLMQPSPLAPPAS